jgi:hypothetical protein
LDPRKIAETGAARPLLWRPSARRTLIMKKTNETKNAVNRNLKKMSKKAAKGERVESGIKAGNLTAGCIRPAPFKGLQG